MGLKVGRSRHGKEKEGMGFLFREGNRTLYLVLAFGIICSIGARASQDELMAKNSSSAPGEKEDSFADIIDRALEIEFADKDQPDGPDVSNFNNSVADQQDNFSLALNVGLVFIEDFGFGRVTDPAKMIAVEDWCAYAIGIPWIWRLHNHGS